MIVTRRQVLAAGSLGLATVATVVGRHHADRWQLPRQLVVFDGRNSRSRAFGANARVATLDVAGEYANLWRGLRHLAPSGTVAGLTRWEEFVIVRNHFEEQGKRVRFDQFEATGRLIHWEMA